MENKNQNNTNLDIQSNTEPSQPNLPNPNSAKIKILIGAAIATIIILGLMVFIIFVVRNEPTEIPNQESREKTIFSSLMGRFPSFSKKPSSPSRFSSNSIVNWARNLWGESGGKTLIGKKHADSVTRLYDYLNETRTPQIGVDGKANWYGAGSSSTTVLSKADSVTDLNPAKIREGGNRRNCH